VALITLFLGPIALYRRTRDRAHKVVGYVWMVAMLTAAVIIGTIVISPNLAARAPRRRNLILPLHRARGLL